MKKFGLFVSVLVVCFAPLASQPEFAPQMVRTTKISKERDRVFSKNKEFQGLIELSTGNPEFIPIDRFVLKDHEGRTIYEKADFGHTLVDISNQGSVVGIDFDGPMSGHAKLHFYNEKGEKTGERSVGFLRDRCFTADGKRYCVNDGGRGLRMFDASGQEIHELGPCNWFAASFDGNSVAMTTDNELILLEAGLEMARIPLQTPFIRDMRFSSDGALLGYLDNKNLHLLDVQTGENVFTYRESEKRLKIVSFDIASDNSALITGCSEDKGRGKPGRHEKGFIYLFDMEGNLRWKEEVTFDKWNIHIPKVNFAGSDAFTVTTVDEIFEYQF